MEENDVVTKIETFMPLPGEVVVVTVDFTRCSNEDAAKLHNRVKSIFPENIVLTVPDSANLQSLRKDQLEDVIGKMSALAEKLK